MQQIARHAFAWPSLVALLAGSFSTIQPATAEEALEREHLAAITRQLDLIDRVVERAASSASLERTRYHFDYTRLRSDLERIRGGLQDYLVPPRAQPRDPAALAGDYTRRDARESSSP